MSNGNKRNRSGTGGGGGGGGGGGNQQRRRRSGGSSGGGNRPPQAPNGPAMTALGESTYEAVFDHGGSGYGVWFDGVVRDDPMYKQFWKGTGTRPLYVRIEEDRIVLLKELDRDLPVAAMSPETSESSEGQLADGSDLNGDVDVDAAIEEAVAEAMAAAEAAVGETADTASGDEEKVYSPEEAAALFAAGDSVGDAAVTPSADVDAKLAAETSDGDTPALVAEADAEAEEAPVKPKRRAATRRKAAPKKPAADDE